MSLQIASLERQPLFYELSLTGRLDASTYLLLEQKLDILMTAPIKAIVLELGMLEYVSSMGLRVIFKAMKDLKALNALLMLTNMQPQVKKVFEIAQAIPDDSLFSSIKEADAYYDAIQKRVKRGSE